MPAIFLIYKSAATIGNHHQARRTRCCVTTHQAPAHDLGRRRRATGPLALRAARAGRHSHAEITAGHPDLTIFLPGGKVAMIENKAANGRLSPEQRERHAAMAAIGHTVVVLRASTEDEEARLAVETVRGWLAANYSPSATTLAKDAV